MRYETRLRIERRRLAVTEWLVHHVTPYRWWTSWRGSRS